jgi:hypothetical protein
MNGRGEVGDRMPAGESKRRAVGKVSVEQYRKLQAAEGVGASVDNVAGRLVRNAEGFPL